MKTMEFRKVDELFPDQVELGDFLKLNNEIVEVLDVTPTDNGVAFTFEDDYGDRDIVEVLDDEKIEWFILEE